MHSRSTIEGSHGLGAEQRHTTAFTSDADHPPQIAATDNAATPVEIVLSALANCLMGGLAAVAENRGIKLNSAKATVQVHTYLAGILGINNEHTEEIDDLARSRRVPSAQPIAGGTINLNALRAIGVRITGRLSSFRNGKALFSGGLAHLIAAADLKMQRTLDRIDDWIAANPDLQGTDGRFRPETTVVPATPRLSLQLDRGSIATIIWATDYAPDTSWLDLPISDARGRLQHADGVCPVPGVFALGLPILPRRASHQISAASADTDDLSLLIARHFEARRAA